MISVAEAAEKLGVHRTRINQMIDSGQLPALRIGRAYAVRVADLESVKERPSPGRPPLKVEAKSAKKTLAPVNGKPKAAKKKAAKKKAGRK